MIKTFLRWLGFIAPPFKEEPSIVNPPMPVKEEPPIIAQPETKLSEQVVKAKRGRKPKQAAKTAKNSK